MSTQTKLLLCEVIPQGFTLFASSTKVCCNNMTLERFSDMFWLSKRKPKLIYVSSRSVSGDF